MNTNVFWSFGFDYLIEYSIERNHRPTVLKDIESKKFAEKAVERSKEKEKIILKLLTGGSAEGCTMLMK